MTEAGWPSFLGCFGGGDRRALAIYVWISRTMFPTCASAWTPLREIVHPFAEGHSWPFSAAGGVRPDAHVGSASLRQLLPFGSP